MPEPERTTSVLMGAYNKPALLKVLGELSSEDEGIKESIISAIELSGPNDSEMSFNAAQVNFLTETVHSFVISLGFDDSQTVLERHQLGFLDEFFRRNLGANQE